MGEKGWLGQKCLTPVKGGKRDLGTSVNRPIDIDKIKNIKNRKIIQILYYVLYIIIISLNIYVPQRRIEVLT